MASAPTSGGRHYWILVGPQGLHQELLGRRSSACLDTRIFSTVRAFFDCHAVNGIEVTVPEHTERSEAVDGDARLHLLCCRRPEHESPSGPVEQPADRFEGHGHQRVATTARVTFEPSPRPTGRRSRPRWRVTTVMNTASPPRMTVLLMTTSTS